MVISDSFDIKTDTINQDLPGWAWFLYNSSKIPIVGMPLASLESPGNAIILM